MKAVYFDKYNKFQEYVFYLGYKVLDKKIQESVCGSCHHQKDTHRMNCIECCPIRKALNLLEEKKQRESIIFKLVGELKSDIKSIIKKIK